MQLKFLSNNEFMRILLFYESNITENDIIFKVNL